MSTPTTSIPAAKLYVYNTLKTGLVAASGYGLVVSYDAPGKYQPADGVWVAGVINRALRPFGMTGALSHANAMIEEYDLQVYIDCFRDGYDQAQAAYEAAYSQLAQVETLLRADPTLGGAVDMSWPQLADDTSSIDEKRKGRRVRLIEHINCKKAL